MNPSPAHERVTTALSLLFPDPAQAPPPRDQLDDEALHDLALDGLLAGLAARRREHDLTGLLAARLTDPAAVTHRQAVFQNLEADPEVVAGAERLAEALKRVRRLLAGAPARETVHQQRLWHLQAARAWIAGLGRFHDDLAQATLTAPGLRSLREHLATLIASRDHQVLAEQATTTREQLGEVRARLHLEANRIEVTRDDDPSDYAVEVAEAFARFRAGPPTDPELPPRRRTDALEHLDAAVLDHIAHLHPAPFAALAGFVTEHATFTDVTMERAERELAFFLAVLDVVGPLRRAGLPFCYPDVSGDTADTEVLDSFDLVLADALLTRGQPLVTNDLTFTGEERVLVVTGANQGGKTTFARMVGQVHHLAGLGAPVPGRHARLRLPDRILTAVARGERLEDRRGRLLDDLVRIRAVLDAAGPHSLVIANELFRSTTSQDAAVLGRRVLDRLVAIGASAVVVTFLDELAAPAPSVVSLVATLDADEPSRRTFRVERRAADGRADARAIARRHRLTAAELVTRIPR